MANRKIEIKEVRPVCVYRTMTTSAIANTQIQVFISTFRLTVAGLKARGSDILVDRVMNGGILPIAGLYLFVEPL